jgi:uncharacterized membrane protein
MLSRIGARQTHSMRDLRSGVLLDRSFHVSITLKGLHALLETVGGIALLIIDPRTLNRYLLTLLHQELSQDPRDFIATHLVRAYHSFVSGGKYFASFYLLSHGVVKLVLVLALFWNKLWAYPLMIIMLASFIFYQLYRFAFTHSLAMILLTLFDLVVIVLTWLEYRKQRAHRQFESPRASQS